MEEVEEGEKMEMSIKEMEEAEEDDDVVEVEADAEEALVPILNLAPYLQTVVTCEWVKVQKKSSTCADPEG